MHRHDVLILGSGLAALTTALRLADQRRVAIVTKRQMLDGASDWAQGGIAAAVDNGDSVEAHVRDTLVAGAGLCDEAVTRMVASQAREMISWLTANGVAFTPDPLAPGGLHLAREGGHSRRRVVHAADATGHAVQTSLLDRVRAHPNIETFEQHVAIDLITGKRAGGEERQIHGAYALNKDSGEVETFAAGHTVLATGGAGKVYLYTSNPDTATGDGIAMAWRAGCRVANLEFMQFHPTCLYHPHAKSFLITEAVRGEGGRLLLPDGSRFMQFHDERAELAPRDVVARAIDFEMKKRGIDCVYLDISHKPADFVREHFPTIHRRCLELGIDITRQPIPVVPAAHYTCGGVVTDMDARTDLRNLYAVGEVTFTGLHGANRLASNSLLECLVFGHAAARDILATPPAPALDLPPWDDSARHRSRRGSGDLAQLGRAAPLHVELRRHRAHQQAADARLAPHPPAARRDRRVLPQLPRQQRPDRAAQPGAKRRPHHPLAPSCARKAAACTTAATTRRRCRSPATRCSTRVPGRCVRACAACPAKRHPEAAQVVGSRAVGQQRQGPHRFAGRPVAQHDQGGRNKTVAQYFGIAPFGRVIQALQPAVCRNTQAGRPARPPPTPHAQARYRHAQQQLQTARQRREIEGGQRQQQHARQQQPQSA